MAKSVRSDCELSNNSESDVSVASTTNLDGERIAEGTMKRSVRDKVLRNKLHRQYAKNGRHDIPQVEWCRMHKLKLSDLQWSNLEKAERELPSIETVPVQRIPLGGAMSERCGFFKPHNGKLCMHAHKCLFYHSTVSNPPDEFKRTWQSMVKKAAMQAGYGSDTHGFKVSKQYWDFWWPANRGSDPTYTETQERESTCDPNNFGLGFKGKGDNPDKGKGSSSGKQTYKSKSDSSCKPDKGKQDKGKPDKGKPDKGKSDYGKGNPYSQSQAPAPAPAPAPMQAQAPPQATMIYCSDVH